MADRIVVDPQVHFGKPCVAGTRIPVVDVLALLARGLTFDAIRRDYFPDLSAEDVQACVEYAIGVVNARAKHSEGAAKANESFWEPHSLAELIDQQQVQPVEDIDELSNLWPGDDEPEEVLEFILARRAESRVKGTRW